MNKKKITYVVNVDWAFISHRLSLALEAIKLGFEVYIIGRDTGFKAELESYGITFININFERSGKNPLKEIKLIFQLKKIYRQINPDILHHITLKPALYGTIAAKKIKNKVKIVNAVTGLGYLFTDNRLSMNYRILLLLLKYAFKGKEASFVFQNPDDRDLYKSWGFLTDNNYIICKGAGVDENKFSYNEPKMKEKINITLLARMLKDKGVLEFIAAAERLRPEYEQIVEFVLIGKIDDENPTHLTEEELLASCDGHYIKWLGHRNDVKAVYEESDIVCLPSYREGLPKSLVEAMAIGRPIITTDAIGCRECVDDGVNGYLVPIKNAAALAAKIKILILDSELRIKMGLCSREKMVKEMSLKNIISKTFEIYEG